MKSNFGNTFDKSTFGGELRDDVMQYQLDNEVGSLLEVSKDEESELVKVSLFAKNGQVLGHGTIDIAYSDLKVVHLNHKEKRLEFTFKNGTKIYCALDDLYDSKQDKLISGENISTINEHNLLLGGDVHIPYVEKSNINGNIILDKVETNVYTLGLTINGRSIVDESTNTAEIPLDEDIRNDSTIIGATTHAIKEYVDTNINDTNKYFNEKIETTQLDLDNEKSNRKALAGHSIVISQDKVHIIDVDLINANGESISHQEINLDDEHIIDKVDLDYAHKKLIFTFKDGHTLDCDISDLINDLDTKIKQEEVRAINKENHLQDDLDSEISRAKIRENELNTLINDNDEKQTTNLNVVKETLLKKINDDIDALDLEQVGQDGYYIKFVSEENGKVSATKQQFDQTISNESTHNNTPTSQATYTFVDDTIKSLDVEEKGEDGKYIKFIKEDDGKIEATLNEFETLVDNEHTSTINAPTTSAIKTYVDDLVDTTKNDINSRIDKEVSTLNNTISNEAKTREENDIILQTNIDNEVKRASGVETELSNKLNNEISDRQQGDKTLQDNIDTTNSTLTSTKEELTTLINTTKEDLNKDLRSYVDNNVSDLDNKITSLGNQINLSYIEID